MSNKNGSNWIRREKRLAIYSRDGFACVYCGSIHRLGLDHLQPREVGGTHDASNLVTACVTCNSARQDKSMRAWLATLRSKGVNTSRTALKIRQLVARQIDMTEGKRLLTLRKGD